MEMRVQAEISDYTNEETCILLCIGVWHLQSCFPIAVIGWEMCKKQKKPSPLVSLLSTFFQAVHAVCLLIISWWIRHCGTKGAFFNRKNYFGLAICTVIQ